MTDRQTTRATHWSVTINNPSREDEDQMEIARSKGWTVTGQKEVGAEGTPHYQLAVRTPQVRFSALKKAFPRAHIEVARNPAALAQYVAKEDTRVAQLPAPSGMYPTLRQTWGLIYQRNNTQSSDGWDLTVEDHATFVDTDRQAALARDPLKWLDLQVSELISEGYNIESLAVNPSTRSAWKKYWRSILQREHRVQLQEIEISREEHNHAVHEEDVQEAQPDSSASAHSSTSDQCSGQSKSQ